MKSAILYVKLTRNFGTDIGYDAEKGKVSASCRADGYVWNTESKFESKRCSVAFYRGSADQLSSLANEHGLLAACGSIDIAAGLKPEKFEAGGAESILPPVEVIIFLEEGAYTTIETLLRFCNANRLEVSLSVSFSHRNFAKPFIILDDLDLKSKYTYPIIGFHVASGRHENNVVYCPKYTHDRSKLVGISFTGVRASVQANVWNSEFSVSEIIIDGKLRCPHFGIVSDDDKLEIREYEREFKDHRFLGYPEEAFPGMVAVCKGEIDSWCSVTLYATRDSLNRLATLVSGLSGGDTVRFDITMKMDDLPLELGDTRNLDVVSYTPTIVKVF